jgi:hypothetical protein
MRWAQPWQDLPRPPVCVVDDLGAPFRPFEKQVAVRGRPLPVLNRSSLTETGCCLGEPESQAPAGLGKRPSGVAVVG